MSTSSIPLDALTAAFPTVVQGFKSAVTPEVYAEVAKLGIAEQFPEVIALTRELFGDFTIKIADDPEIEDCVYVTFNVRAGEAVEEAFAK